MNKEEKTEKRKWRRRLLGKRLRWLLNSVWLYLYGVGKLKTRVR